MFLRKNFIDKAFQKWRFNCQLLKFHEALNPSIQPSINEAPQTNSIHQSVIS